MATPDDQARAIALLVDRWLCHAQGKREQLSRSQLEEHAAAWERWQGCLDELAHVLEGYRRA